MSDERTPAVRPDPRPQIRHRRAARPLLALLAAALVVGGCGSSVGGVAVSPGSSVPQVSTSSAGPTGVTTPEVTDVSPSTTSADPTTTPPATSRTTTSEAPTPTSPDPTDPAEPAPLAFGQSFRWANGIEVTVGAPEKYTPEDAEESREYGKEFVSFSVTLVNGSEQAYQARDLLFAVEGAQESRARRWFDADLPAPPEIALVPGQSATWTWAYGVSSSRTITVRATPDPDNEDVTYTLDGTGTSGRESGAGSPLEKFIGVQKFGGTYTFADGVQVAVGAFRGYTPGKDAYGEKSPRYLQSTITVTNGSRETISPTVLSYGLAEKTRQRVEVRAPSEKIATLPEGRYPPGSKFTVKIAFGVQGTAGLALDVRIRSSDSMIRGSGSVVFTDLAVPVYSSKEPGAPTPTRPTSSGTAPGPVDDEIAVRGTTQVAFGSKITWTNGVTAVVGKPAVFTPENTTRRPRGARAVKYTVTIMNGSREPVTSILLAAVISGGFHCEPLVDSTADIGDSQLAVEPGRTTTMTLACWAKDPTDLVVQLRPDQYYDVAWASSTGPQEPRTVAASEEAESDEAKRTFGDTFVYASGISVAVRTRSAIPVGAVAGDGTTHLAVEGTFTNNTDAPFRVSWSPKVFDGDDAAETFYNDRDFIGPVSGLYLLPGRSLTLAQGVILKQPDRISVTTRDPSYDGPTITWTR